MIRHFLILTFVLACHLLKGQSFVITNVNIIPMTGDQILENQSVLITKGKIKKIGPADDFAISKRALEINGKGKYLMPGLVDMHMHYLADNLIPKDYIFDELPIALSYGVTAARVPIGQPFHLEIREQIKKGMLMGPDLYIAGHIAGTRFGDDFSVLVVEYPDKAAASVTDLKEEGYDLINLTYDLSAEVYDQIMEAAKIESIPVFGLVPPSVGIWKALEKGQNIEHLDQYFEGILPDDPKFEASVSELGMMKKENWNSLDYFTEQDIDKLVDATVKTGVWNTPTNYYFNSSFGKRKSEKEFANSPEYQLLSPAIRVELVKKRNRFWSDPPPENLIRKYVRFRNSLIKKLYIKGGKILAGSNSPEAMNLYGLGLHRELQSLVEAGLSPYQALETATILPAKFLGMEKRWGTVTKGKRANLLLLDKNPLVNISNTLSITGVFKGEDWIPRNILKYMYSEARKSLSKAPLR